MSVNNNYRLFRKEPERKRYFTTLDRRGDATDGLAKVRADVSYQRCGGGRRIIRKKIGGV